MTDVHDAVLVFQRRDFHRVLQASAITTLVSEGLVSARVPWDASLSDVDNYAAAVRLLLERRKSEARVITIARLPMSTLNGAPYAFLLDRPL